MFPVSLPRKQVEMFRFCNTQNPKLLCLDHVWTLSGPFMLLLWTSQVWDMHPSPKICETNLSSFHSLFFSAAFSTLLASCTHQGGSSGWTRQTKQLQRQIHWSSNKSIVLLEQKEAAWLEIQLSEPSIQWKLILMITWDLTYKWNPEQYLNIVKFKAKSSAVTRGTWAAWSSDDW